MIHLAYSYPLGNLVKQGEIAIDATITEHHSVAAQVTDHQVEFGPNVTDHIRPMPKRLTLETFISNVPISTPPIPNGGVTARPQTVTVGGRGGYTKVSVVQFDGPVERARDVFGDIVDAALNGALFTVTTSLRQYTSMAVTAFNVPRDANVGNSLQAMIDFQEIRFATAVVVKGLTAKPKAQAKPDHKGDKAPKEVEAKKRSGLLKLGHAFAPDVKFFKDQ